MPDLGTILGFALVGLVFAGAARLYRQDARAYRAGQGDELYAWLRRSHPDHPALSPAPPVRMLRVVPQRWGWRHAVITAAQVVAIGSALWLSFVVAPRSDEVLPPIAYLVIPLGWIILVAFATAVLTRLWDLSAAVLARRGGGASEHHQAVGEADRVLASRRRLGEGA